MSRRVRHYLILGFGWFFIFLGFIGLFLPVLQGILFLCIGAILLARESPRMRWLVMRLGRRYPKFRTALEASRGKARQRWDRLSGGRKASPQDRP